MTDATICYLRILIYTIGFLCIVYSVYLEYQKHKQALKDDAREAMRKTQSARVLDEWVQHDMQYTADRTFREAEKIQF